MQRAGKEVSMRNKSDLRSHLRAGDRVVYESMKACKKTADVSRNNAIACEGRVLSVYRDFAVVSLSKVHDCANRMDVISVNGRRFR